MIEKIKQRYKISYMIRQFEKKVEEEFEKGTMRGTTHGCIGQEIIPTIVMEFLDKEIDYVVGTHRCHGQVLAYTHDPYRLICEMMGKADGFIQGMGGSQHIKVGKYVTNGITGGMVTVGCGIALGLKKDNSAGIVVAFMGVGRVLCAKDLRCGQTALIEKVAVYYEDAIEIVWKVRNLFESEVSV